MIIDITRKPVIIFPEDCPSSVVVRSIGNRTVSGFVSYWVDQDRKGRRLHDLDPDARMTRGDSTCYETRLPLPGTPASAVKKGPYETVIHVQGRPVVRREPAPEHEVEVIPPDPYECPSVWKDMLTGVSGTWRVNVRVEFLKRMKRAPWAVSVFDGVTGSTLATIAVSTLDPNPLIADNLPLKRAIAHTVQPGNAWTRILDDDAD